MIYIDLIIDLIILFLIMIGFIYLILFLFKQLFIRKKLKKEIKIVNKIQLKITSILKRFWIAIKMVLIMTFSVVLAMGIKPLIYKINYPLGWGYANFASYIIAICLYLLISPSLKEKKDG